MSLATGGCLSGSLATNTGPNGPHRWSTANRQQAHVGETVGYSFILIKPFGKRPVAPYGYVDYCVATIGNERVECEPDLDGHFCFEHRLDRVQPGDELKVRAVAYRQYGQRDFMKIGDKWLRGDSPSDQRDSGFVSDSLTLRIYQARIELGICESEAPLDFETGKLELVKADGTVSPVYQDRDGRPGFDVTGPDDSGCYTVVYLPDGTQVNPAGRTEARLTVHDRAGHPHTATVLIPTP
ncbi:MAG TPA: hypothetical protein VM243_10835 [Phycisphaerae bacterium]|nr:hypothetical protein [Phycisphaerae bacterium]